MLSWLDRTFPGTVRRFDTSISTLGGTREAAFGRHLFWFELVRPRPRLHCLGVVLMERTMRWMILWLVLTAIWISYSFLAGSGPKVVLIPPALVLIALVFTWLWKRLVVRIAGEFEPSHFHPHGGAALLLGGLVGGFAVYAVDSALTPQLRPDAGADNQSAAPAPQNTPPVRSFLAFVPGVQRIIGGAKPDPSAGTPGPAPALQPQPAPQQKPQPGSTPLPQSILAAKPLGPASQFQPPSATPARSGIAQQLRAQPQSNQPPGNQQQVATPAQQQTAPQASATPAPHAAIANDDDRPAASRRVRHPRKQATFTSNAPRYRDENYVPRYGPDQYGAWSGGATSYGEPRFQPDARYVRRSRVI